MPFNLDFYPEHQGFPDFRFEPETLFRDQAEDQFYAPYASSLWKNLHKGCFVRNLTHIAFEGMRLGSQTSQE